MLVNYKGQKYNLPDFLIIGATKSGTTSLYHYLRQHPNIFMPAHKEPFFFNAKAYPPENLIAGGHNVIRNFEDYVELFRDAKEEQIIGEATPSYLHRHQITIETIKSIYGNKYKELKIIVLLRNPVDRIFSQYLFCVKNGWEPLPFMEAINPDSIDSRRNRNCGSDRYLDFSMYYEQVKAFLEEFSLIKIYLFEELKTPEKLVKETFGFLSVDHDVEVNTKVQTNPSGIPKSRALVDVLVKPGGFKSKLKRILPPEQTYKLIAVRDKLLKKVLVKPKMDIETRRQLINFFKDDILSLQALLNRDLSSWLDV